MGRSAGQRTRTRGRAPDLPVAAPPPLNAVTASARILNDMTQPLIRYEEWQTEAWDYWDTGGELYFAVGWRANSVSRVRLRPAKLVSGSAEPEFIDDGPVSDLVEQLAGGIGGQAMLMKDFGLHLSVPGEANLVIYDQQGGERFVGVRSSEDVRVQPYRRGGERGNRFELRVDEKTWEVLPPESLVVRLWSPHPRHHWRATSSVKAALPILREIDFYNRRIIAILLSRLASNGFLLLPEGMTFPVNPEFKDAPDPFIAQLVDTASRSIKNPGTAAAAIPMPLRIAGDFIDKIRHLTFANDLDSTTIANRDQAIRRLAATLDMPAEIITGVGETNHWNAASLQEDAIKTHISPLCEVICNGLTTGYLKPMMQASGIAPDEDGTRYLIWYDPSELTARPDLAERALQLGDRIIIDDEAQRREAGFDEADAPTVQEAQRQLLRQVLLSGGTFDKATLQVIGLLSTPVTGVDAAEPASAPTVVQDDEQDEGDAFEPSGTTPADDSGDVRTASLVVA